MIGRLARVAIIAVVLLFGVLFAILAVFRTPLFNHYVDELDAWTKAGGNIQTLQTNVVENCGKLVMSQASVFQNVKFLTYGRDDFDFYVDICTKMTVNRIHKQPEFEKPQIVTAICGSSSEKFLQALCRRSGL